MEKLYNRIDFHNGTVPALNDANLNAMSKAIDDIDNRVCGIASDVISSVPTIETAIIETERLAEEIETLAVSVRPNADRAESAAERAEEAAKHATTTEVIVTPYITSGTHIADISVNGKDTALYCSGGGSGGASSYNELSDRPTLGELTIEGSHDLAYYGIASAQALSDLADIVGTANAILEGV